MSDARSFLGPRSRDRETDTALNGAPSSIESARVTALGRAGERQIAPFGLAGTVCDLCAGATWESRPVAPALALDTGATGAKRIPK